MKKYFILETPGFIFTFVYIPSFYEFSIFVETYNLNGVVNYFGPFAWWRVNKPLEVRYKERIT